MSTIPFHKLSPSGNMTLLFEGLHFSSAERAMYASQGLLPCHIGAEQAGFVDIEQGILEMAGGEFCINATRSLALLMALKQNIANSDPWHGVVHSSGFTHPLQTTVIQVKTNEANHKFYYNVDLSIPLQEMPNMDELEDGINLVRLPGISHILIDEQYLPFKSNDWQNQAAYVRAKYGLMDETALGCIWWHERLNDAVHNDIVQSHFFIHPVVSVKNPWAEHYENACGSGSLALALWHYSKTKLTNFIIQQPGGHLTLRIQEDIQALKTVVGGPVNLVASGMAYFD